MLDEEQCKQFIMYVNSIFEGDKEIMALEDTARFLREGFYKFFEDPVIEVNQSEEELKEIQRKYEQIYQPVKKLIKGM